VSLHPQQVDEYKRSGFLLLEGCFSGRELAVLRENVPVALAARGEETVLEDSGEAVRSVYGLHRGGVFSLLARHPRLVEAARALLGGDVYVYQSKLNCKSPFVGDVWEWHQDYIYWRNEDAMPAPRVLTAAVFLDDVDEFNGPLVLIPGSQREGVLPCRDPDGASPAGAPAWRTHVSARLKYAIDRGVLTDLAGRHGLHAPKGRAGAVLLFDSNLAHASAPNISPFCRSLVLYTYNHVDNAPPRAALRRPEFLVSRDERPVEPVADDALLRAEAG
jgi:ectoine hydroxylase